MDDGYQKIAEAVSIPPGKMQRFQVGGEWVLVVNLEGEYFALADTCSHEDASLSKGAMAGDCIRCPLHGSRFNIKTGFPIEEPAEEPVDTYPVRVDNGDLYIGPARRNVV